METYIIYKENSDHARTVIDYLRDFKRQTGKELVKIDPDSRAGADMCRNYDVVEYPTILTTDNQGMMQQMWRGLPLPTISEVSYYAN